MADRTFLSNDTHAGLNGGVQPDEEVFTFSFASLTSAHTTSSVTNIPVGVAKANGRVVDFGISVYNQAVSASGFISGDVSAGLRLNSASILSTAPVLPGPILSTANTYPKATNKGNGVSAVINANSANFSTGDLFSIDYATASGGSAAAGVSGKGLSVWVKVRYAAI